MSKINFEQAINDLVLWVVFLVLDLVLIVTPFYCLVKTENTILIIILMIVGVLFSFIVSYYWLTEQKLASKNLLQDTYKTIKDYLVKNYTDED